MSFTSSKIANNFPVTAPVAGSCLKILEELQIIEKRTNSSSASRYMPKTVDMDRMLALEKILIDSYEITDFQSSEQQ
jgi:7,8-dihydro-6-hydroxymethylpterin-pyrophosphokinase